MPKINKEYRVFNVKKGTTKNEKHYTVFRIKDSKRDDTQEGGWKSQYYTVFVFADLPLNEESKITFNVFKDFSYDEKERNGQYYKDVTIYADVNDFVIVNSGTMPSNVSTPFDNMAPVSESSGFKAPWD